MSEGEGGGGKEALAPNESGGNSRPRRVRDGNGVDRGRHLPRSLHLDLLLGGTELSPKEREEQL